MEKKVWEGYIIGVNHKNNPVFGFFIKVPELNLSPDNPNTDPSLPTRSTQRSRPRQAPESDQECYSKIKPENIKK